MSDPIGKVLVDVLRATLTELSYSEADRLLIVSEFWLRWKAHEDRASKAPSEGDDALHGYSEEFAAQKAHAYGTEIMRVWGALKDAGRPADGKTRLADAVRAAIAAEAGGKEQDHG